jgi:adenosine deaminase
MHYLGFNINDLYQMNLNAIDYAFISASEKEELKKKLLEKKESQL